MLKRTIVAALAVLALAGCEERRRPKPVVPPAETEAPADAPADGEAAPTEEGGTAGAAETAAPAPIETLADSVDWPATGLRAKIVTSKGDILAELYPNAAPRTVANFVQYAKDGHYDRLIIHRIVPGFVIRRP